MTPNLTYTEHASMYAERAGMGWRNKLEGYWHLDGRHGVTLQVMDWEVPYHLEVNELKPAEES